MCFFAHANHAFVWDLLDSSLGFCRCRIYNLSNCGSFKRGNNHSSKTKERTAYRASNVLLSSMAFTDYLGGSLWAKYLNVV